MEELVTYYENADEDHRLVRQNITKIEFDTTTTVLSKYLTTNKKITELGAATGCYSLHYASTGHQVTAVELVSDQIDILRQKAIDQDITLQIFQGDAQSIPFIESESQDVVLILVVYFMNKVG